MKKRLLSILLALILLVGLLPAAAFSASAVSTMTTSDEAVAVLKSLEGFSKMGVDDNGQFSIGYGTRADKADYPDGITEEEAEVLLREHLTADEGTVNKFADENGLTFTQNQFDALVLLTYNVGSNWMSAGQDIRDAVISGKTGNDFIFYLTRWCSASSTVSTGLIARRLAEADMYLNGYYATKAPSCFSYVLFQDNIDANQKIDKNSDKRIPIQGYDATTPAEVRVEATLDGHAFLGWYTAKEGGKWVDVLDDSTKALTLYAHFQAAENGGKDSDGNIVGTAASYQRITGDSLSVYDTPSTDATAKSSLAENTKASIVADYLDGDGTKWGLLSDGGWIDLSLTEPVLTAAAAPDRSGSVTLGSASKSDEPVGVSVCVTANYLNYRLSASTSSKAMGALKKGTRVTITQVTDVNGTLWGKCSYGWICLTYTDYASVVEDVGDGDTVIAIGTVTSTGNLSVRAGAGTGYAIKGKLASGSRVDIYQITRKNNVYWGKISSGWICLTYVDYTMVSSGSTETEKPSGSTETEKPSDSTETDKPSGSTGTEEPSGTAGKTGRVTASKLNVRKEAGVSHAVVGSLSKGDSVTITEQKLVGNVYWGKVESGWVCMTYIQLDTTGDGSGEDASGTTGTTPLIGVVTASNLCVRQGAGTSYAVRSTIPRGTKVTILQQALVDGTLWGQIDAGWICMSYVSITSGGSNLNYTGFVTASKLVIRTGAGTGYTAAGSYSRGDLIKIRELKQVNGTYWAHTPDGWVCMNHVQLVANTSGSTTTTPAEDTGTKDPEAGTETGGETGGETGTPTGSEGEKTQVTGVVTASNLCVRSAPGTTSKFITTIPRGTKVVILRQTVLNGTIWAEIEKGWICMSYVSIDSGNADICITGMVTASELCIRSNAGTTYAITGAYRKGDVVEIFETVTIGTTPWGRTADGWICLNYVSAA